MMLQMRLKHVLEDAGFSQAEIGRAVGLSATSINLLVNRSQYPKSPEPQKLRSDIIKWLSSKGLEEAELVGCFEPSETNTRSNYRKRNSSQCYYVNNP